MSQKTVKPYATIPLFKVFNFRNGYRPPEESICHPPEKVCKALNMVKSVGITQVRFSEEEPLLYPYLEQVIQYAVNLELEVYINANIRLLLKHLPWLKKFQGSIKVKVRFDTRPHGSMATEQVADGLPRLSYWKLYKAAIKKRKYSDVRNLSVNLFAPEVPAAFQTLNGIPCEIKMLSCERFSALQPC